MTLNIKYIVLFIALLITSCAEPSLTENKFRAVPVSESGMDFRNDITETVDFNIFNYMYFYNGGGVAVGDLNGNGLLDVFFTANQNPNKLYLNRGDFVFEDITEKCHVGGFSNSWATGVNIADVNGDGRMDIYVSYLGDYLTFKSQNQLFINLGNDEDGIPQFEDQASAYGLNLVGFSTQAVFFDYDLDGDLDMFMLNHSVHNNGTFGKSNLRNQKHPLAGDRLLKNENGKFIDVTDEAGIFSSAIGYGLGVTIGDVNLDGFPDIYVGNDFHENDYLYINQGDGTFANELDRAIRHTSHFSMGVDMGDINNDAHPELITLDMLPSDPKILKASAAEDPYDVYNFKLDYGFSHQFARNTLQINNGNGTFSETGLLSGIYATDWSWSTFFADLDLDGHKDIFIANGIIRRSNDLDYINFITDEEVQYRLQGNLSDQELALIEKMPTIKLPNYVYKNNGDLTFSDVSEDWGLDIDSYSNGAAYADLDNDGDLDIIINNINDVALLLENKTIRADKNTSPSYLKILLNGTGKNPFGIGVKVIAYYGDELQFQENQPAKGFMSTSDYRLNFGFSEAKKLDSLYVIWPDFTFQKFTNLSLNQTMEVDQNDASGIFNYAVFHPEKNTYLSEVKNTGIDFQHQENNFNEFTREPLLPHMISTEGPAAAVADINGDGLEDLYIGGAKRQSGIIYLQQADGHFLPYQPEALRLDSISEDVAAVFADISGNGAPDLVVVSGGNEYSGKSEYNCPRLYLNDGKGNFSRDEAFPMIHLTGSTVAAADYNGDGDIDLFIGARAIPWEYGKTPQSYLLENNGKGKFRDVTMETAPQLKHVGFVKDAKWIPLEDEKFPDLVIAAEWSPITIFKNNHGKLERLDTSNGNLEKSEGWWNVVIPGDFDGDGKMDFILGNLGQNSKLKASGTEPIRMYVHDFDQNGTREQILSHYMRGREYPFYTKDELTKQLPAMKKQFLSYSKFAEATLEDMFGADKLKEAKQFNAYQLNSIWVKNEGNHRFSLDTLPVEAQYSPVMAGLYDAPHHTALLGGNFHPVNVQRGRYDASWGLMLSIDEKGKFQSISPTRSGVSVSGEVRKILPIGIKGNNHYVFIRNNDTPVILKHNPLP